MTIFRNKTLLHDTENSKADNQGCPERVLPTAIGNVYPRLRQLLPLFAIVLACYSLFVPLRQLVIAHI